MDGLKFSKNYSVLLELFSKMPSLGIRRDHRHVSLAVTVSSKIYYIIYISYFYIIRH